MLHYNENKVIAGEAKLIVASGFAGDIEKMSFQNKLQRFNHLTMLKPNVKTNAMHISLNFDSSEKLSVDTLQQIAATYMDKIGFGDQPFLVYRHDDSAHLHVHIVSTNITAAAQRMDLHDIGRKLSEPARKAIEQEFDLIKAESKKFKQEPGIKLADPEKVKYGYLPTKRAISNVITAVTRDYKFTSLAELNAILKVFNVIATRGEERTQMFEKKGLMYSILDAKGNAIGVPIKSSAFYSKPTLRNLEKKFERNEEKRKPYKDELKQSIDKILNKYNQFTKATFQAELKMNNIGLVLRQNEQGFIYGTTFIDHRTKSVFNGSDLGKAYSAKALTERFNDFDQVKTYLKPVKQRSSYLKLETNNPAKTYLEPITPSNYLKDLLGKPQYDHAPMIPGKKKRRKKGLRI